jgi:hypothetical protein
MAGNAVIKLASVQLQKERELFEEYKKKAEDQLAKEREEIKDQLAKEREEIKERMMRNVEEVKAALDSRDKALAMLEDARKALR